MRAIYLKDNQAIEAGDKTAIVLPRQVEQLPGEHALLVKSGETERVVGVVTVAIPIPLSTEQFARTQKQHGVTEEERLHWWGKADQFWLYQIKQFTPCQGEPIQIKPGTKMLTQISQEQLWSGTKILAEYEDYAIIGQEILVIKEKE